MWHQWFNCNVKKLREYFLCTKKTKSWLYLTISSLPCQSLMHIHESNNACVWCCWRRSWRSDVEPRCAAPCLQAVEDMRYIKQSEDFDREDDLQFFTQPYLFEPEYTDDELREIDVLRQNAGSCVSSITRMHHGTLMNVSKTDTEDKKLFNKFVIFVFFAHKKYSRSFIILQLNHWCHMDYFINVLTTFLGLERVSYVAVYAGSEISRISSRIC